MHLPCRVETEYYRRIIAANRCRIFLLSDALLTPCATEHYRLDCIASSVEALDMGVFDKFPAQLPRFAFDTGVAADRRSTLAAGQTDDVRALVSMIYAASARHTDFDLSVAELDADLAVVRALSLVFWRNKLLRLHAAERRILCLLSLWPGRTFEWPEIIEIGGCDPATAYTCIARIRAALRNAKANAEYLFTVGGRGVFFAAGGSV